MQDRPIGEDATTAPRQVAERSRYTAFRTLDTLFTRGEVALKMVGKFSQCGLRDLAVGLLNELSNSNKVSAMDVYGQTPEQAAKILKERLNNEIEIEVTPVSGDGACLKTLQQMQWTLEQGMQIELLTENKLVVGIRTARFQDNPPG